MEASDCREPHRLDDFKGLVAVFVARPVHVLVVQVLAQ